MEDNYTVNGSASLYSGFQRTPQSDYTLAPSPLDALLPFASSQVQYFQDPYEELQIDWSEHLICKCSGPCYCAEVDNSWFPDFPAMNGSQQPVPTEDFGHSAEFKGHSPGQLPFSHTAQALPNLGDVSVTSGLPSFVNSPNGQANLNKALTATQSDNALPSCSMNHSEQFATPEKNEITAASRAIPAEKKAGRRRCAIPKDTKAALEESFRLEPYPDKSELLSIAKTAKMAEEKVKTWFSNKRSRTQPHGMYRNQTCKFI
jgi:hypothetical protein